MKTLRQWTHELMARQFLDGLIVGFLCGAVIVTMSDVWWINTRGIVRAARSATPAVAATNWREHLPTLLISNGLSDDAIDAIDPDCGLWEMDGDGHGGTFYDRALRKVYRANDPKKPHNGNFTRVGVADECKRMSRPDLVRVAAEKRAAEKADFDAKWEEVSRSQCGASYRARDGSGGFMSTSWCLTLGSGTTATAGTLGPGETATVTVPPLGSSTSAPLAP